MGGAPIATRTASVMTVAASPTCPARRRRACSAGPMLQTPGRYPESVAGLVVPLVALNVACVTVASSGHLVCHGSRKWAPGLAEQDGQRDEHEP